MRASARFKLRRMTVNPFVSEAQRRACYAKDDPDWNCKEWGEKTPKKLTKNARRNPLKYDPTRTVTLRRAFRAKLHRQFSALKVAVMKLVGDEDAFGIGTTRNSFNPDQPRDEDGKWSAAGSSKEEVGSTWSDYAGGYAVKELSAGGRIYKVGDTDINGNKVTTDDVEKFSRVAKALQSVADKSNTGHNEVYRGFVLKKGEDVRKLFPHGKEVTFDRLTAVTQHREIAAGYTDPQYIGESVGERVLFRITQKGGVRGVNMTHGELAGAESVMPVGAKFRVSGYEKDGGIHVFRLHSSSPAPSTGEKPIRPKEPFSPPKVGQSIKVGKKIGKIYTLHPSGQVGVEFKDGSVKFVDPQTRNTRRNPFRVDPTRAVDTFRIGTTRTIQNTRWQYETDPDAVAKFQEWLKTQLKATVRSRTSDQLWDAYIQAGFKKGVARSFDDYTRSHPDWKDEKLDFYAGSRKQFLESSFRQPVSRDRVKILAGRTFDELENVTTDMSTKMSRVLIDGLIAGKGRREVADDLVRVVGLAETRANTIAQTELIRAHAEGQLVSLDQLGVEELGVMVEWSTAGDSAVCDECQPLEGVVLRMDEAQGMIPRHPNAVFAESTFVPYGECLEAVRANYNGPCVVLTASGGGKHRTTIGPNHPIMTSRGLIKAADVREGDKVLYDLRNDGVGVSAVDFKQIPTSANVFNTCVSVQGTSAVSPSGSDLHGDRVFCQGEVEAISPARGLLGVRQSGGIKQLLELFLTGADAEAHCVARPCAGFAGRWGVNLPTTGSVGGADSWVAADDHFVWLQIEGIETGTYTGLAFDYTTESSLYCSDGFVVKNCRCAWMPANVGEDKSDQTRTKSDIGAAIRESRGKDDDWGPGKAVSKDRPISQVKNESDFPSWSRDFEPVDHLSRFLTDNAFCPTGEGGGVDRTEVRS